MIKGINKEILRLSLPSILANITVPLVGMVDIAVAGHLGSAGASLESAGLSGIGAAALIGGITIGAMIFDLTYWNFGFLRISTGGLTAQAYGRKDWSDCAATLKRSLGIALGAAVFLLAIQWLLVNGILLAVKCSPEVKALAFRYFYIRIWAAPATLSLMAFKGWFIGMQDSIAAMSTDLTVNIVNIVSSIFLSIGIGAWAGFGYSGIALGTVVAQYSALAVASVIFLTRYKGKRLSAQEKISLAGVKELFRGEKTRKFFSMNGDIFFRSLLFMAIYGGFTTISARYGDTLLACSSILMKLLMVFSYFIDGFAYAGEAMCGKYIGEGSQSMLRKTIRWCFVWSAGLSVFFVAVYGFGGTPLLRMMTSDEGVVQAAKEFIPWLMLMPVAGCAAFIWDGIFIGATQSKSIRNAMIWANIAFYSVWFSLCPLMKTDSASMHLLMGAYFAHLFARGIYLSIKSSSIKI